MHAHLLSPYMPSLRDAANSQRKTIEAASKRHVSACGITQKPPQRPSDTNEGRDSCEFAEPRELSQHELECTVALNLIPPQAAPVKSAYGFWGI